MPIAPKNTSSQTNQITQEAVHSPVKNTHVKRHALTPRELAALEYQELLESTAKVNNAIASKILSEALSPQERAKVEDGLLSKFKFEAHVSTSTSGAKVVTLNPTNVPTNQLQQYRHQAIAAANQLGYQVQQTAPNALPLIIMPQSAAAQSVSAPNPKPTAKKIERETTMNYPYKTVAHEANQLLITGVIAVRLHEAIELLNLISGLKKMGHQHAAEFFGSAALQYHLAVNSLPLKGLYQDDALISDIKAVL